MHGLQGSSFNKVGVQHTLDWTGRAVGSGNVGWEEQTVLKIRGGKGSSHETFVTRDNEVYMLVCVRYSGRSYWGRNTVEPWGVRQTSTKSDHPKAGLSFQSSDGGVQPAPLSTLRWPGCCSRCHLLPGTGVLSSGSGASCTITRHRLWYHRKAMALFGSKLLPKLLKALDLHTPKNEI